MQKTKKQLLGLAGLAAVGVMTAIACGIPAPNASAYQQETIINVQVSEGNTSGIFSAPKDGAMSADAKIRASINYSYARRLDFYLTYKDDAGATQRIDLPSYYPETEAGTYNFEFDVAPYGLREYELHVDVTGYDNVTRETDTVSFTYDAAVADVQPGTDDKNNPTVGIEISDLTEHVIVAVFDEDGKPAFTDANGNIVSFKYSSADADAAGKILATLPFDKYNSKAGTYAVVISAYNKDNEMLSMQTIYVKYDPAGSEDPGNPGNPGNSGDPGSSETPETPNTGMLSAGDFNISRADYIATGLIAFSVIAGAALILVYRKSRR